ncbi:DUF2768 family protein [Rhodobacteraceae bacterium CCMM004]|nr:DUF2768 family protein [Rhodobacteraceae bacterium CCMM004]
MGVLKGLLWPFQTWNDLVLPVGRWIAVVAIGLMVVAILIQVFFRYVLNNALPWPDEAARFAMLWMTGLIAPMAFRRGGFVAIDMLGRALPRTVSALLSILLLLISGVVLAFAMRIGFNELGGFGAKFATASLYVPFNLGGVCEILGAKPSVESLWCRVPRSWMMASLFVGVVLLFIVNVELLLREILTLLGVRDLKSLAAPENELMAE